MTKILMGKVNRKSLVKMNASEKSGQNNSRTPKKLRKNKSGKTARRKSSKMSNCTIDRFQQRLQNILKANTPNRKPNVSIDTERPDDTTIINNNTPDFIPIYALPHKKKHYTTTNVLSKCDTQVQRNGFNLTYDDFTASTSCKKSPQRVKQQNNSRDNFSVLPSVVNNSRKIPVMTDVFPRHNTEVQNDESNLDYDNLTAFTPYKISSQKVKQKHHFSLLSPIIDNRKKIPAVTNVFPRSDIQNDGLNTSCDSLIASTPYKISPQKVKQKRNFSLPSPIVDNRKNMPCTTNAKCSTLIPVSDIINVDDESGGTLITIDEVLDSSSEIIDLDSIDECIDTVIQNVFDESEYITIGDSIDLTNATPVSSNKKCKKKENNKPKINPSGVKCTTYDLTNEHEDMDQIARRGSTVDVLAQDLLGQCYRPSNSVTGYFGTNYYRPRGGETRNRPSGLRMVIIDGSNVAMQYSHGKVFSVEGLKICIDYFLRRGHTVRAFVPRFRNKNRKSSNPELLQRLEEQGHVIYTPARQVGGKYIVSYDDRYIVQCAAEFDGVVVSNDDYRDILLENDHLRETIENRLLPFTWVNGGIMFPHDPLGRNGPKLDTFLRHPNS